MDRDVTGERAGTEHPGRALVVVHAREHRGDDQGHPVRRVTGGRPMAGFLAQLIVDADPALRPARSERTRAAAELYARTAGIPAGRRRA